MSLAPGSKLGPCETVDSERFLTSRTSGSAVGSSLRMILNWPALLKK